jgi:preprotein translocase subunit SecF
MHDEPGLFHLHNLHARIDGASELSDAERAWLHETAERTGRIAAEMQEAARILEDLRAEDTGTITAEREAEIDAKVASQLARIEAAQADLQALAGQLEQRIEGAASLADADKEKLKKLLELAKQRKLTPQQAEAAAGELGGSQQVQQVLLHLLILFILIVILGAG